jgi:hypothetical protein
LSQLIFIMGQQSTLGLPSSFFLSRSFSWKLTLATISPANWPSALGELGSMLFQVRKNRLVGMAVRVFGKKIPGGGISSYGAAAMTESQIVTGKAILLLNEEPRPGLQALAGFTIFQQICEAIERKDVTEVKFRVAGDPTITLSDKAIGI